MATGIPQGAAGWRATFSRRGFDGVREADDCLPPPACVHGDDTCDCNGCLSAPIPCLLLRCGWVKKIAASLTLRWDHIMWLDMSYQMMPPDWSLLLQYCCCFISMSHNVCYLRILLCRFFGNSKTAGSYARLLTCWFGVVIALFSM